MNLAQPMNPIMSKVEANTFGQSLGNGYGDHIHNYGSLPQTFLNSSIVDSFSKLNGNNKPLKVVEMSDKLHQMGDVVPVSWRQSKTK